MKAYLLAYKDFCRLVANCFQALTSRKCETPFTSWMIVLLHTSTYVVAK